MNAREAVLMVARGSLAFRRVLGYEATPNPNYEKNVAALARNKELRESLVRTMECLQAALDAALELEGEHR